MNLNYFGAPPPGNVIATADQANVNLGNYFQQPPVAPSFNTAFYFQQPAPTSSSQNNLNAVYYPNAHYPQGLPNPSLYAQSIPAQTYENNPYTISYTPVQSSANPVFQTPLSPYAWTSPEQLLYATTAASAAQSTLVLSEEEKEEYAVVVGHMANNRQASWELSPNVYQKFRNEGLSNSNYRLVDGWSVLTFIMN